MMAKVLLVMFGMTPVLSGCYVTGDYPVADSHVQQVAAPSGAEAETRSAVVEAARGWQPTSVQLHKGDVVNITGMGKWVAGLGRTWVGGEGINAWASVREVPVGQHMSLIGRIGDGYPFVIGRTSSFLVRQEGSLYLRANEAESVVFDNLGALTVTIKRYRAAGDGEASKGSVGHTGSIAGAENAKTRTSDVRQKLAIVVGISAYENRGKWNLTNLRYARRDAEALTAHLKSGGFDQVITLTDAQATTRNLKMAMREKLRGVQKDDFVLIFWAGHGSPDPHEPEKLYLITHDTDPRHMASTAYAMNEFKADNAALKAKRVLVIADACHSAGISDPKIGIRGAKGNKIVDGIRGVYVGSSKPSGGPMRMIFTSCEAGEVSRESSDLGGGHGVFTWFLLQALAGKADQVANGGNGNGKVELGEVIEYTRDKVKRFTGNQQHPDTAGRFDRNLIMGVTK